MATAIYIRDPIRMITHTAAASLAVDEIVPIDNNIAVTRMAAQSGESVQAGIGGVWRFPKVTASEIKAGERVSWVAATTNVDNNAITPASGDVVGFGVAVEDAASGDTEVLVDLTPSAGVRTA